MLRTEKSGYECELYIYRMRQTYQCRKHRLWLRANDCRATELLALHKPLTPAAAGILYMKLMRNIARLVWQAAQRVGHRRRPTRNSRLIPKRLSGQYAGASWRCADIRYHDRKRSTNPTPPGNVNLSFKKCVIFYACSETLQIIMEKVNGCALREAEGMQ
jgi:hypothetical protein